MSLTMHSGVAGLSPATAAATLAAWRARDVEVRAALRHSGVARPEQVAGLTGLQVFEKMFAGELPFAPIGETLNFCVARVAHGEADFLGTPLRAHYNPLGSVHGGWIATLLDSAMGCAVHTALPAGKLYTTLELKVNYVRAITDRVPMVMACGRTIHVGGRTATAEGWIVGAEGTLYAHATTTCLVFDPPALKSGG